MLGCPRHRNSVSLFTNTRATMTSLGTVTANGVKVDQAASEDARSIGTGGMHFEDGSTVSVASANDGYKVTVVQSFRLADGTLYTVVRVKGDGELDVTVTPGSTFEVVTPSALIGVRGTEFCVLTTQGGDCTDVGVDTGAVQLENRASKETHLLKLNYTGYADGDGPTGVEATEEDVDKEEVHTEERRTFRKEWRKPDKRDRRMGRKRTKGHYNSAYLRALDEDDADDEANG